MREAIRPPSCSRLDIVDYMLNVVIAEYFVEDNTKKEILAYDLLPELTTRQKIGILE